jgi:putative ABC transport system substrate-binding protein
VRRRDFISLLAGVTVGWPLAAFAQQPEHVRRIGVLMSAFGPDDPEGQARIAAFREVLERLGWTDGRNVRMELRWSTPTDGANLMQVYAQELAALSPDVIVSQGSTALASLLEATRTIPIVFTIVVDPVGAGYVESLARPGGNATGFLTSDYSISAKWLELLKEIAPSVKRVAVLRDPALTLGTAQFAAIQAVAPATGVEVTPLGVHDPDEIERGITTFARTSNGGLIVTASPSTAFHRHLIIALAARHKLPSVYVDRYYVKEGGLLSYGPSLLDEFRRAASYVDRILKGEKPANLPVQAPTECKLVINLNTAKAFGLTVPPSLLARADEVIE